jgi:hypothetical protein
MIDEINLRSFSQQLLDDFVIPLRGCQYERNRRMRLRQSMDRLNSNQGKQSRNPAEYFKRKIKHSHVTWIESITRHAKHCVIEGNRVYSR